MSWTSIWQTQDQTHDFDTHSQYFYAISNRLKAADNVVPSVLTVDQAAKLSGPVVNSARAHFGGWVGLAGSKMATIENSNKYSHATSAHTIGIPCTVLAQCTFDTERRDGHHYRSN